MQIIQRFFINAKSRSSSDYERTKKEVNIEVTDTKKMPQMTNTLRRREKHFYYVNKVFLIHHTELKT